MRLDLLLIICTSFFLGLFCGMVSSDGHFSRSVSPSFDTIVVKTDSCHFYMDSAFYTIDERKIEYVKD